MIFIYRKAGDFATNNSRYTATTHYSMRDMSPIGESPNMVIRVWGRTYKILAQKGSKVLIGHYLPD